MVLQSHIGKHLQRHYQVFWTALIDVFFKSLILQKVNSAMPSRSADKIRI
ncbi:hypothetical protein HMPREF1987_01715 [Peptostreptococcaceae bacterium oral taxon 113 str. W5053]|nr:hypothetical protein HMPREF1987_01715 [Peptostreptococcaceae bacterium oral taxon 113 str. W5053]